PATLVYPATISDWTHITVVYQNRQPTLYVNGTYIKSGVVSQKSFVHAQPGDIGGMHYGFFDGQMDNVRVYNRAMTAPEVQSLAQSNTYNAPPSVTLTSPADGATQTAPVNISLGANAVDDGTIRKVEFFAGTTLIATKTEAPFIATWVNAASGTYSITAKATDDQGISATSAPASITVNPAIGSTVPPVGSRLITADIVALDQVFFYNRLGAFNPSGMIYALRRDVVPIDPNKGLTPGNVQLRADKRPRPIVLRMNVGDRLQVKFQNLLAPSPADDNQPHTRTAAVHVIGMQLVNGILDDGSNVGRNQSSLIQPGDTATYTLYAEREGNHLLYSSAATTGGEGDGGSLAMGLFGSVNVEAKGAEWYRSQMTAKELAYATTGRTAGNQPIINYDAVYPSGHPRAGQPVVKILNGNLEIMHSDLNAIITGPNKGCFTPTGACPAPGTNAADGTYRPNPTEPNRNQPFREFTVVYHDEIKAVQAFPQFEDPVLGHTLHSVRDGFAINYGTGGIGSEIIANRLGVGPMANCTECKYEDFFLSAWTVGDPAQIVDVPANTQNADGTIKLGAKATKVLYPDDPSNVHHSYLNDHVKMRVVHAGPKEHHVHHLHAHQWLRTPDSDNSSYLDSQALGPGYSFTTEITHGGSGNRNKTVGDSIFHCHFYPHFAQGMWELWRTHDVFEEGTKIAADGRPEAGARALPDGEIERGTPIPAIVPVPTIAMAPMPTATFKGYPFFVPGVAGHRPPHPPLDTVHDGGLARHVITGGRVTHHKEHLDKFSFEKARLDFDKTIEVAFAKPVDEKGTADELAAMDFHGQRTHASYTPSGATANFITNGLPRKTAANPRGSQPGAPLADPCIGDAGEPIGSLRTYKAANIQLDIKLNKAGWHFKQSRIGVLWEDVKPTLDGTRPPEPFFFRANTNDCIEFHHTNLVPHIYVQDDFQVRTPTDIMGQHIHLVKFDVLASDGAGNGFNYEDGTFAPGEVQERIHAIRAANGCVNGDARDGSFTCPTLKQHPSLGLAGKDEDGNGIDDWLGAQTTIQRWFADDVLNNAGKDRTLRTVFTHDHFGPSTHQQAGFYAGLVVEPRGSTWKHNETGVPFGTRADGGPTSWQAIITTNPTSESYREFLLEFADFQLAYRADGTPVNPPAKKEIGLPYLLETAPQCPGGAPRPCPEAVSADDPGTMSVNYRNEPLALRVLDNTDPNNLKQAEGEAGDLAHAYRSLTTRKNAPFNSTAPFYNTQPLTKDVRPGDPFTPLLRAYEDDNVQIRILVGGFEEGHNFGVHGIKWKFEPDDPNSGWRNNQMMGISEHYEFVVPKLPRKQDLTDGAVDYLYQPGAATDDQWNGLWGLMRAYKFNKTDLIELPNNTTKGKAISNQSDFKGVCPRTAPERFFDVTAISAQDGLPEGTLVYNARTNQGGRLHDPTAIIYVRSSDLDAYGKYVGSTVEPLILRANAGDCINVTLKNRLPGLVPDLDGFNTLPMIVEKFNANQVAPSNQVGLHPQAVFFDVSRSNGMNVGINPVQTIKPGETTTYQWYAGEMIIEIDPATGLPRGRAVPIEFGATNLVSSDPIKHSNKGAIGALIIEPQGATWIEDTNARAQATVTKTDGTTFREFVLLFQNDVNLRFGERFNKLGQPAAVPNTAEAEDPEDSGQKAFNYRTEPLWKRMGFEPNAHLEDTREVDFTNALSNKQVSGFSNDVYADKLGSTTTKTNNDPKTPVFTATAGTPVRFRVLMPAGHARNNVFQLHGHIWEEEPYTENSSKLGSNPLSEWKGSQFGIGPSSHFDMLLKNGAGGMFKVTGDYLFRTMQSFQFDGGLWGIFRVTQ
ncbi:MAG TPA: Ig-like domain-containing protein, partial [Pyrinomonadaceae bacterium]